MGDDAGFAEFMQGALPALLRFGHVLTGDPVRAGLEDRLRSTARQLVRAGRTLLVSRRGTCMSCQSAPVPHDAEDVAAATMAFQVDEQGHLEAALPGGIRSYTVTENLENRPSLSYRLQLPEGISGAQQLSTARVARDGGATPTDLAFQLQLFYIVGGIVVAAGLIEAAMKRLLLLLTGRPSGRFSEVDVYWTTLEQRLRAQCDGAEDERRVALLAALDWASENRVKQTRDDVVHAQWWVFAGVGVRRNRFYRRQDGATLLASMQELQDAWNVLVIYERRLDGLLGDDWAHVVLPRLPDSSSNAERF